MWSGRRTGEVGTGNGVNANVFPGLFAGNWVDTQPFESGPASLAHLLLAKHKPSTASCCCWHVYSCLSSSDSPPSWLTQQVLPGTQVGSCQLSIIIFVAYPFYSSHPSSSLLATLLQSSQHHWGLFQGQSGAEMLNEACGHLEGKILSEGFATEVG